MTLSSGLFLAASTTGTDSSREMEMGFSVRTCWAGLAYV
jgi:hypothetical protein